jgi:hypothetical protein
LVLTCSQNNYPKEELNALFTACPLKLFGGVYPMLTLQDDLIKQGALIIGFREIFDVTLFTQFNHVTTENSLEEFITSTLK